MGCEPPAATPTVTKIAAPCLIVRGVTSCEKCHPLTLCSTNQCRHFARGCDASISFLTPQSSEPRFRLYDLPGFLQPFVGSAQPPSKIKPWPAPRSLCQRPPAKY